MPLRHKEVRRGHQRLRAAPDEGPLSLAAEEVADEADVAGQVGQHGRRGTGLRDGHPADGAQGGRGRGVHTAGAAEESGQRWMRFVSWRFGKLKNFSYRICSGFRDKGNTFAEKCTTIFFDF